MTYYESAEGMTISRERALRELEKHYIDAEGIQAFFSDLGEHEEYDAQGVLDWLGY